MTQTCEAAFQELEPDNASSSESYEHPSRQEWQAAPGYGIKNFDLSPHLNA